MAVVQLKFRETLLTIAYVTAYITYAVVAIVYGAEAQAQKIYQCKDAGGRLITSDRPIPECDKAPMKELGRDGLYRRDIAAPLTPEQIRQREEAAEKKKLEEIAKRDQERRDSALLTIYRNEQDIEHARQRALKQLETDVATSKNRSAQNARELQMLQKEVAGYGKRPVPLDIQRRLADVQTAAKAESSLQTELQGHLVKMNLKYDQELARFREITGASKSTIR